MAKSAARSAGGAAIRGKSPGRRLAQAVVRAYMRRWHDLRFEGDELLPERGPTLVLTNHASILDIAALVACDPYPDTVFVAKASTFKVPGLRQLIDLWGAIPVDRQGRDVGSVRRILAALREGRVVALAPEGGRSRNGRLAAINPVLARIAVHAGVPLTPVGIRGSFAALPAGRAFPRRRPITVRVGRPFFLEEKTPAEDAAQRIRAEIAGLLPLDQQPLD